MDLLGFALYAIAVIVIVSVGIWKATPKVAAQRSAEYDRAINETIERNTSPLFVRPIQMAHCPTCHWSVPVNFMEKVRMDVGIFSPDPSSGTPVMFSSCKHCFDDLPYPDGSVPPDQQ
jgi:hypothetical protein